MLAEYLRFFTGHIHDKEYKFFKNFQTRRGTVAIVGYNGGKSITTFRAYDKSHSIIQFEKDPLLEPQVRAMSWIAGKDFRYYMVGLDKRQRNETVFFSREQATANTLASADADALKNIVVPPAENQPATRGKSSSTSRLVANQHVVETQLFDMYQLCVEDIIINEEDFTIEVLEGMTSTIAKWKPTFMVPNQMPTLAAVVVFLSERNYRPYSYDPDNNLIKPMEDGDSNKHIFFVHTMNFQTDIAVKM